MKVGSMWNNWTRQSTMGAGVYWRWSYFVLFTWMGMMWRRIVHHK